MEQEIEEFLNDIYKLKIEVKFLEFRNYKIIIKFRDLIAEINFTYDNHYTFEANMNNLINFIDRCIINYHRKG